MCNALYTRWTCPCIYAWRPCTKCRVFWKCQQKNTKCLSIKFSVTRWFVPLAQWIPVCATFTFGIGQTKWKGEFFGVVHFSVYKVRLWTYYFFLKIKQKQNNKEGNKFRLTPAYFAIIGLYATWMPKLGDGPLWDSRMGLEQERCQISWWKNLLYINNYIGNESLCMFQSWYLATDTQLFVLAPLILYPLWKWKTFGRVILGGAVAITTIIPFLVTYLNNLDPTLLVFPE